MEYYSERSVSLREIAAEQVQLSIPMKPLCEENCQGLCPTCGANLNRGRLFVPCSGERRPLGCSRGHPRTVSKEKAVLSSKER